MIQSMATERWDATISLSNKTTLYHMTRIPHLDHIKRPELHTLMDTVEMQLKVQKKSSTRTSGLRLCHTFCKEYY